MSYLGDVSARTDGAARDAATAAEWDFHNTMLAVKEQVIAQFGKNSDQVQALGLKKKSEYKAPTRKANGAFMSAFWGSVQPEAFCFPRLRNIRGNGIIFAS